MSVAETRASPIQFLPPEFGNDYQTVEVGPSVQLLKVSNNSTLDPVIELLKVDSTEDSPSINSAGRSAAVKVSTDKEKSQERIKNLRSKLNKSQSPPGSRSKSAERRNAGYSDIYNKPSQIVDMEYIRQLHNSPSDTAIAALDTNLIPTSTFSPTPSTKSTVIAPAIPFNRFPTYDEALAAYNKDKGIPVKRDTIVEPTKPINEIPVVLSESDASPVPSPHPDGNEAAPVNPFLEQLHDAIRSKLEEPTCDGVENQLNSCNSKPNEVDPTDADIAENIYNKIKEGWNGGNVRASDNHSVTSSVRSNFVMKPAASMMSLSKGGDKLNNSKMSINQLNKSGMSVANNVNIRLYNAGLVSRQKNEIKLEQSLKSFDKLRKDHKFYMNAKSRELTKSLGLGTNAAYADFGQRLHDEGLVVLEDKKLITETKKKIEMPLTWSCSRCAHIHTFSSKILHEIDDNIARYKHKQHQRHEALMKEQLLKAKQVGRTTSPLRFSSMNASELSSEELRKEILKGVDLAQICEVCKWDQTHVIPFRPCIVIIEMAKKAAIEKSIKDELRLHAERQGIVGSGLQSDHRRPNTAVLDPKQVAAIAAEAYAKQAEENHKKYVAREGFFEEMHQNTHGMVRNTLLDIIVYLGIINRLES